MHTQISIGPRVLFLLLFAGVILSLAAVFLFLRLDGLVHGGLYEFGLQFSNVWAQPYWFYAQLILGFLGVMTISSCISAAYFQIRRRAGMTVGNQALGGISFAALISSVSSVFLFTQLDLIVHSELYNYGLQFSYAWAGLYWNYAKLMLGFVGVVMVINFFLVLHFFSNDLGSVTSLRKLTTWTLSRLITWLLVAAGSIALVLSVVFESSILTFIGLGVLFWGLVLFYVTPQEYVPENIAASMAVSSFVSLNQIIENLGYLGRAFYLSPSYSKDFESSKVYIGREVDALPPENLNSKEKGVFCEKPEALVIDAPGTALLILFEETLGTKFTNVNLRFIQEKINDLVDNLEIARSVRMSVEKSQVHVLVDGITYKNVCREVIGLSRLYGNIGCPISSAIACALAKATANLITIEKEEISEDGKSLDVAYRIVGRYVER